jgi:hypothetical protein
MSTADRVWGVAAIVLGTSAAILAGLVWSERRDVRADLDRVTVLKTQAHVDAPARHSAGASAQSSATDSKAGKEDRNAMREERRRALYAARMKVYSDPESRSLMHAQHKSEMRTSHPDMAQRLKLSAEEEDQLLDLLANHQLKLFTDPRSASRMGHFELQQQMLEAEIEARFGSTKFREYQAYEYSLPERQGVRQFRGRLDEADDLTSEASERLIDALAGERRRAEVEANEKAQARAHEARGATMMFGSAMGRPLWIDTGADAPLESASEELQEHDRQLEKVASPLLNVAQRKAFTEHLDEARESSLAQIELMMERFGPRLSKGR